MLIAQHNGGLMQVDSAQRLETHLQTLGYQNVSMPHVDRLSNEQPIQLYQLHWLNEEQLPSKPIPVEDNRNYLVIESIDGVEPLDSQFGVYPQKTVPDALHLPLFGQPEPTEQEIEQAGGEVDNVPPMQTYAILDAAKVVNFTTMLSASKLQYKCLFKGEAFDELKEVAPYIVQLEENNDFTRNLFSHEPDKTVPWFMWDQEPGIYVRSRTDLNTMQRHFRKFTKVQDENGKWFYFRFWEPQHMQACFELFTVTELASVFHNIANFLALNLYATDEPSYRIFSADIPATEYQKIAQPLVLNQPKRLGLKTIVCQKQTYQLYAELPIPSTEKTLFITTAKRLLLTDNDDSSQILTAHKILLNINDKQRQEFWRAVESGNHSLGYVLFMAKQNFKVEI